jgi:membrane associated rhomboid family serine protease
MEPLRPRPRIKLPERKPRVTYTILGITIFVYLLQFASDQFLGFDLPAVLGAKANPLIQNGQIWRLLTPMLLHGSPMHIAFNMYALYSIGRGLELFYGGRRFLALYGLAGFTGNVVSFLLTPNPAVGSSTAVFGLLAAEGVFIYRHRDLIGSTAHQSLWNILSVAGINLLLGFSPGIDNWGHAGGLVGGGFFAWAAGPLLRVKGLFPEFQLDDEHGSREVILTLFGVGGLFALAAAVRIVFG